MTEQSPLVAAPTKRGRNIALIVGAVVVLAAIVVGAVVVSGNASTSSANEASGKGSAKDPVKIGVVGKSDPYWAIYQKAALKAGIHIDLVNFTDYTQENPAVTSGDLDLNQFEHIVYLAQYNVQAGEHLTPVGSTAIYPLGLYSTKYKSVKDIPNGATVAIPDDASNLARGLLILKGAGLIAIKGGGDIFSTLADIDTAKSRVTVTTLDASLTPTSLPDVAAAIINNDYVNDAGLKATDAIAEDDATDPASLPYVNLFVARPGDKNIAVYTKLVSIYQNTKAVTDGVVETSGGTAILLKTPVVDLVTSLKAVEAKTSK
jgi:D-methionine transport system substrate-binding protein